MSGTTPSSTAPSSEDRLAASLMVLARSTMRILREQAVEAGLSMPQGHILTWLAREGPRPTLGWARRTGTSPSTVSELVDGLEVLGFVRRLPNPEDRRQVLVEITPAGRRLEQRMHAGQMAHLRSAISGLSATELNRTIGVLEGLTERLSAVQPPVPSSLEGPSARAVPRAARLRRANA